MSFDHCRFESDRRTLLLFPDSACVPVRVCIRSSPQVVFASCYDRLKNKTGGSSHGYWNVNNGISNPANIMKLIITANDRMYDWCSV